MNIDFGSAEAVRGWSLGGDWGVRFYSDSGGWAPQLPEAKKNRSLERSGTHKQ